MPTTNDPITNQNPQTAANTQIAAKPEDNFDFDINLDNAPKNELENNEININKEIELKTEESPVENTVGNDLSIDLPESYVSINDAEKVPESVTLKPEPTQSTEKPMVSEDTSWLKGQDAENKKSEESLFGAANDDATNVNSLKMAESTEFKEEVNVNSQTISLNDKLGDTSQIDINKVETKNEQFDIEKTDYSNDMKIIEGMTGVKPIEGTISSNPVGVSLPKEETTNSINLDMLVGTEKKIENNIQKDSTENKTTKIEIVNSGNEEKLYPNLLKGGTIEQDKSDLKKNYTNGPVNISQSLNMELNAISPDTTEPVKKSPNHLIKFILPAGIIAVIGVLGYFIVTTMFPVETGNIVEDAPQIVENIVEQTGTELTGSDITLVDTGSMSGDIVVAEGGDANIKSGHAVAGDGVIDPIGELNNDTTSQGQLESLSLVDQIKLMTDEANTFLSEGQSTNNKVYIKYGGTISKKCTELVGMLENRQEIDNLSGNLAQLEGYLQKLRNLKNENAGNSGGAISQEASGQNSQTPINQAATFKAE